MARHNPKAAANERKYPYAVSLAIAEEPLDLALIRQIIEFHKARHIEPRHGRTTDRNGEVFYRWCFSDLHTARGFIERFGGKLSENGKQ